MTFLEMIGKIDVWDGWLDRYQYYVPKFIEEAKTGKNWDEWDKDVFYEFFEKRGNQCIASLRQGSFENKEQQRIKENWDQLAPLLQQLAMEQEVPNFNLYQKIKKVIRSYCRNNKRAATNRLIAGLQPKLLSTIVSGAAMRDAFSLLHQNFPEIELPQYNPHNWFKNSYAITKLYQNKFPNSNPMELITLPWQTFIHITEPNKIDNEDNDMSIDPEVEEICSLLEANHQIILQGPPGIGKTHLAKEIAKAIISDNNGNTTDLAKSDQYKLIQFHPSYSYEDFVRGIVVETNDNNQIEYVTKNKILGEFAQRANQNYISAHKSKSELEEESILNQKFEHFIAYLRDSLDEKEKIDLTKNIYLFNIVDGFLMYRGDNWANPQYMNFNELEKLIRLEVKERIEFRDIPNINRHTREHATYFLAVLNLYYDFIQEHKFSIDKTDLEIKEKPYILIIDEINRANLASVLGELIYALEYRGEPVESIYAIDSDHQITLPKNLYIIGTMNTADRSVGYIDYAIRRRFAFYEMLPHKLDEVALPIGKFFHEQLFESVSKLFIQDYTLTMEESEFTNASTLNPEFSYRDVWLGHSYFIYDEKTPIEMRLEYEIKPILHEYVKDGILNPQAEEIINELSSDRPDIDNTND